MWLCLILKTYYIPGKSFLTGWDDSLIHKCDVKKYKLVLGLMGWTELYKKKLPL